MIPRHILFLRSCAVMVLAAGMFGLVVALIFRSWGWVSIIGMIVMADVALIVIKIDQWWPEPRDAAHREDAA